jgi:pimeloyl-ACP methyl ester carboxylesterase
MRELFGKGPAPWVSAALVACSPLQFLYAQEARQYALWTLLVVAASAVLQRALRRDRVSDWWLYGILTGLGLYAHLLFAAMIPIHALYGFLARPDDRARFALQARCWAAAVSAALIGFIPWVLVLTTGAEALGQNTEWMKRPIGPERVATTWAEHLVRMFTLIGSPAYPTPPDELRQRIRRSVERGYHSAGVARQLVAVIADGDRSLRLRRISCPTLVIHGRADPLVPFACGVDTAVKIPNSRLVPIDGFGHDFPPQLFERLGDLIARHALRSPR